MGLKRKRNLKIDNTARYAVYFLKEINNDYLEDYVEVHDSGMEADEEKESQLQKIIQNKDGSIPLPIIKQIENAARNLYGGINMEKEIKWRNDCKNEYIEKYEEMKIMVEETEDGKKRGNEEPVEKKMKNTVKYEVIKKEEILEVAKKEEDGNSCIKIKDVELIKKIIERLEEGKNVGKNDHPGIVGYVKNRMLRRFEDGENETYVCFRKRMFHPTFKSRRNESVMIEKLERMQGEFFLLKNLCELLDEKCKMEYKYIKETNKILKVYNSKELTRKDKIMYRRRMAGLFSREMLPCANLNIFSMMVDRSKIEMFKNIKRVPELYIDAKYANNIYNLINYRKRSNGESKYIEDMKNNK